MAIITSESFEHPNEGTRLVRLLDIREGRFTKDEVLSYSERIEEELVGDIKYSKLQEHADHDRINELLIGIQMNYWAEGGWEC